MRLKNIFNVGATLSIFLVLLYRIKTNHLVSTDILSICLAVTLFLISHFIRALRMWIVLSKKNISLSELVVLQLNVSVVSFISNLIFGEFLRITAAGKLFKIDYKSMFFTILFLRIFDILFICLVCIPFSQLITTEISYRISLLIFGCLVMLCFLLLFSRLSNLVQNYLSKYVHTANSTRLVKLISESRKSLVGLKVEKFEYLFIAFLLTGLVWVFELVSVYIISYENRSFTSSFELILTNVLNNIFSLASKNSYDLDGLYNLLFMSAIGVVVLLVLVNAIRENGKNK